MTSICLGEGGIYSVPEGGAPFDLFPPLNPEHPEFKINLLFHYGHYNVITSLTTAFICNYFCEPYHVSYDHKGNTNVSIFTLPVRPYHLSVNWSRKE